MDSKAVKELEKKTRMGIDGEGNLIWGFTMDEWRKLAEDEGWSITVVHHHSKNQHNVV